MFFSWLWWSQRISIIMIIIMITRSAYSLTWQFHWARPSVKPASQWIRAPLQFENGHVGGNTSMYRILWMVVLARWSMRRRMKKGRKYFEESDENADIRLDSDPAIEWIACSFHESIFEQITSTIRLKITFVGKFLINCRKCYIEFGSFCWCAKNFGWIKSDRYALTFAAKAIFHVNNGCKRI